MRPDPMRQLMLSGLREVVAGAAVWVLFGIIVWGGWL